MSQLQRPPHTGPSNQCLTGCLYQVIQTTGLQGSNVLKLLPILKPKDSLLPVVPSPLTPSRPTLNVPQAVLSSPPSVLPPPVSILSRPSPVSVPLVQTPALGNYIITAQNNVTNSNHVENPFLLPETKLFVDNTQLTIPVNSVPANPTILMMNKTGSPIKPTAMLPAGHSLQIPAHAEVISLPVSSLPYSIQQKILPQVSGPDTGKNPSVIYVSPVNTVKSNNNQSSMVYPSPNTSNIIPKSLLQQRLPSSTSEAQKEPMKWVVQETRESAACLVPVKSTNDTASKILQILSKTKMEDVNLTNTDHSKVVQIKDNALVMCNNKIFFLTKKGTELVDAGSKIAEPPQYSSPDKPAAQIEPMKDLSNKVVQVVLSKSKSPPPIAEQSVQSNVVSTAKPKRKSSTPRPARADPNDIYMAESCGNVSVKTCDTPAGPSDTAKKGNEKKNDQLLPKSQGKEILMAAKAPEVNRMDDRGWRLKFGLLKQEKIILKRIPLIRPQGRSDTDPADTQQNPSKRKSSSGQDVKSSKKQKNKEDGDLNRNTINPEGSTDSPYSLVAGRYTAPGGGSLDTTQRSSASTWPPTYYGGEESDPPDSADFQVHQDVTGHYSGFSPASQRFYTDSFSSSMYPDETTKDEKIQRLKEVLKERERALEAVRLKKMI
ncbi:ligand-dependent nuclear receptor-interacting factor 1-like [Hyla sarda]|uniref:ligand-dependent nuclear receptor-interacting factor 1-like n=1 Tax=Hyla sarda TaxID=327740 RepID=UPI0024C469B6|nr:ligand-dependent nuclear receptor-interacting factor 1-like [Hyla sarda]